MSRRLKAKKPRKLSERERRKIVDALFRDMFFSGRQLPIDLGPPRTEERIPPHRVSRPGRA